MKIDAGALRSYIYRDNKRILNMYISKYKIIFVSEYLLQLETHLILMLKNFLIDFSGHIPGHYQHEFKEKITK